MCEPSWLLGDAAAADNRSSRRRVPTSKDFKGNEKEKKKEEWSVTRF